VLGREYMEDLGMYTQDTNVATQALAAAYATLTDMERLLDIGTYLIFFSGYFESANNTTIGIALFEDANEIGGAGGYTERRCGVAAVTTLVSAIHTQAIITLAAQATITVKGQEVLSDTGSFIKGNLIITKIG